MGFFGNTWKEQNLITRETIVDILLSFMKVAEHSIPDGTIGHLYCVDGIAKSADAIMDYLEERAIYEKERAKKIEAGLI
jgi:hypothetical protein